MKACSLRKGIAPLILNLGTRLRKVVRFTYSGFTPGTEPLVPSELKVWWTEERVRTAISTEKKNIIPLPRIKPQFLRMSSALTCTYYGVTDTESIGQLGSSSKPFCLYLGEAHSNLGREIGYPEVLHVFIQSHPLPNSVQLLTHQASRHLELRSLPSQSCTISIN